jgi:predicted metal-dependent phosphoesterase TrpH
VAITDHHTIDVERIRALQELGKERSITVLPGIELRSELGGSDSIHFIGIFPEDGNLDRNLDEYLQVKLQINERQI